jgi:hypothetical protein
MPTDRTDNAAGYIKHNDQQEWAIMESSVARLLRVAVSISHTTVRGLHERVLADFCRRSLSETARKRSEGDPCSPRLRSTIGGYEPVERANGRVGS